MKRSVAIILTLAALAVVTPAPAAAPQTASTGLLEHIPADTPYVFTNLEPLPAAVIEKLKSSTHSSWETSREILRTTIEEEAKKAQEKGEETDLIFSQMVDFLMEHWSWEGLQSLGFGFKGHMAIYGVSLVPVIRIELEDPGAFRAAVARFEERVGSSAPKGTVEGQDYWVLQGKEANFYFAVVGSSLVASSLPAQLEAELLPVVLGLKKPSPSLADSGRLHQLVRDHGYLPYGAGYIDIRRVAEIVLGESADEYTKLLEALGPAVSEIDQACKKEALEVAQTWPMAHAGYTEMTTARLGLQFVLQASPEMAGQLQGLASQVPGIGTAEDGILSLGVSLNLPALRNFVATRAASLRASPYQCKQLAGLGSMFDQIEASLNEAPPPLFALGLRGVRAVIQSIDLDPETSAPRDLQGFAVVYLDDPVAAFQTLQLMSPDFADLILEPNSQPVALPEGLVPPNFPEPVILMTQDALAASVGTGGIERLQAALNADTLQPTPLLSLGYRLADLMQILRPQMEAEASASEDSGQAAETEMVLKMLDMYDYMKSLLLSIGFTDQGVVFRQSMELN